MLFRSVRSGSRIVKNDCDELGRKTPSEYPPGSSFRCKYGASSYHIVYRYANGVLYPYPSPTVAASWDPNWISAKAVNCTGVPINKGALNLRNERYPSVEGEFVKCHRANTTPTNAIYRYTNGLLRQYLTPTIAKSWDPNYKNKTTIKDCDGIVVGPIMELNNNACLCLNCDEDERCGGLWRGVRYPPLHATESCSNSTSVVKCNATDTKSKHGLDVHTLSIHIVVSYCSQSLHALDEYTIGANVKSVHVISKCGLPLEKLPRRLKNITTVEVLPNVGRCDHSYAHYIVSILDQKIPKSEEDTSVVLFLKDSMSSSNIHQGNYYEKSWSDLESMTRVASSSNGFACGLTFKQDSELSAYHERDTLMKFTKKSYNKRSIQKPHNSSTAATFEGNTPNIRSFIDHLGIGPVPEMVQVCYGGVFAASVKNIKKIKPSVWKTAEEMLSRGDNIQESHFMERSWGLMLANPLQDFQIDALATMATAKHIKILDTGYKRGTLQLVGKAHLPLYLP